MTTEFDPYHKWLGIPPCDQPPNHYRLLGIQLFESDHDVIETAAEKQMSYLQSVAIGPHTEESQSLLNEVAHVKVCLLNPVHKSEYDNSLQQEWPNRKVRVGIAVLVSGMVASLAIYAAVVSSPQSNNSVSETKKVRDIPPTPERTVVDVVVEEPPLLGGRNQGLRNAQEVKHEQNLNKESSLQSEAGPTKSPAVSPKPGSVTGPEPAVAILSSPTRTPQLSDKSKLPVSAGDSGSRYIGPLRNSTLGQRRTQVIALREQATVSRLQEIYETRRILLGKIKKSDQVLKKTKKSMKAAKKQYNALDSEARAVRESATLAASNDDTDTVMQLQRQFNILEVQASRIQSAASNLSKGIAKTETTLRGLLKEASTLQSEWIVLIDPFGLLTEPEHRRRVDWCSSIIDTDDTDLPAHLSRAISYLRLGEYELALADVRVAAAPRGTLTHVALAVQGRIVDLQGDDESAARLFRRSRLANDEDYITELYWGDFCNRKRDYEKAIKSYRNGVTAKPDSLYANLSMAKILATCPDLAFRDGPEARTFAESALRLGDGRYWQCYDVAAAAYAETGDFDKAIEFINQALVLAGPEEASKLKSRLAKYNQK